jgi:hypothetical protein
VWHRGRLVAMYQRNSLDFSLRQELLPTSVGLGCARALAHGHLLRGFERVAFMKQAVIPVGAEGDTR